MEFRVLGPLEVYEGERPLALGGAKQRALLAVLLLHANEVVSSDRLIDELWGEAPPETARTALQVHISQLRKQLARAGLRDGRGDVLVTQAPGYVLRIDPKNLDLHRFERLVAEGRDALGGRDPAKAATRFREAAALWHGPALADFAYEPFAQAEIARLEELRMAALEGRIEADLALDRHADLVGELESLVAQHPLRERLRALLMLALYRSGRQAEALEAYQRARSVLVEELGIEPSPELQRLEKAILVHDPSLEPREIVDSTAAAAQAVADATVAAPAMAAPAPAPVEEARKIITVVFTDIADSTTIAERLDPERLRRVMTRYFETVSGVFATHGGTVEKFIGDAVMAVFGSPVVHEDDAVRAVRAALELRGALADLNDELLLDWGLRLLIRTGINSGEVVTGDPTAGQALATGEAVTVAARLQQAAEPGDVLVGERTATAARGAFEFGERMLVDAKGKAEGVVARRLVRALSGERPRGVPGLQSSFVGREDELQLLEATFRRAVREREPHLVTVTGEAGIGKTRLVAELWRKLHDEHPDTRLLSGRCRAYGRGVTYAPLGDLLKDELGILEIDAPATVQERLGDREILGLTLGLDAAPDLHPLVARERLRAAWIEFLDDLVADRPAAILIEDLHWAETPLLELLESMLREAHGPLLFVATARPELLDSRPAWGGGHRNAAALRLEPLASDEAARMLDRLLGHRVPSALRAIVVERTEGNPFFLEELLAGLIDQGVLEREGGVWTTRALPEEFTAPDSVHAVLASRVDLLGSREKAALQAASVVGRVFWDGPVRELLGGAEPDFVLLEERDFVRRRSPSSLAGEREFTFKHALTRDVAYSTLPKARRARLHAAFAEWLEAAGGSRDEHAPLLAHHYADAVRPDDVDLAWATEKAEAERLRRKAVAWLQRAAELAFARYAIDEEVRLLRRAVELEDGGDERADLWRAIGRANAVKYDKNAFVDAMLRAADDAEDAGTEAEIYSELAFQVAFRWSHGEDRQAIEEWIARALELARAGSAARARALVARSYAVPAEAEAAAAEAAAVAARLPDLELRSYTLRARADAALAEARYDDARRFAEARLELLGRIADPDHVADVYWSAIPGYLGHGHFEEARRLAKRHDEVTSALTPHHRLHGVAFVLEVEELAARWETIRELTPRAESAVSENLATPCVHNPRSLLVCALASTCLGDDDEARRLEDLVDSLAGEEYGRVSDVRIRLALLRGDVARVERLMAETTAPRKTLIRSTKFAPVTARLDALAALGDRAAVEAEATPLLAPGTYLEPFALRALGLARGERTLVEQAVERFEALGLEWYAGTTREQVQER